MKTISPSENKGQPRPERGDREADNAPICPDRGDRNGQNSPLARPLVSDTYRYLPWEGGGHGLGLPRLTIAQSASMVGEVGRGAEPSNSAVARPTTRTALGPSAPEKSGEVEEKSAGVGQNPGLHAPQCHVKQWLSEASKNRVGAKRQICRRLALDDAAGAVA